MNMLNKFTSQTYAKENSYINIDKNQNSLLKELLWNVCALEIYVLCFYI